MQHTCDCKTECCSLIRHQLSHCGLVTSYGDVDLGQSVAFFLMAPSHCLSKRNLSSSGFFVMGLSGFFSGSDKNTLLNQIEIYTFKLVSSTPLAHWLMSWNSARPFISSLQSATYQVHNFRWWSTFIWIMLESDGLRRVFDGFLWLIHWPPIR